MNNWKIIVPVAVAGIAILVAILVFNLKTSAETEKIGPNQAPGKISKTQPPAKRTKTPPKKTLKRPDKSDKQAVIEQTMAKKRNRPKPKFIIDDDDESNLNAEQRKTIEAIRAALDANSKARVLKLVQALQASDEWPDGVPKSIKMAAIEALGWFGASCLPEIAGFLGDADPDIVQSAIEKYEDALSDFDLSDRERSQILIQATKIINDSDALDSMLSDALITMRNSVAVETIKTLQKSDNATVQKLLPDAIEFFTGEENMNTPEKLDEWYKANQDDADDEEFYGGSKSET